MRWTLLLTALLASACSAPAAVASPIPTAPPPATPTVAPTSSATPIPFPNFAQLSVPSGTVVWVLMAGSRLFRSTNRGDSWQERPLPTEPVKPVPSFIDDHEGWLAIAGSPATQCQAQSVAIWHTADAGATWQRLSPTGIADGQCKGALAFTDATHGFLSASSPNDPPVIYRTADGGGTWAASRPLADPPGFTSQGAGFELTVASMRGFGSALLADVAGNGSGQISRYAFRSSDGGATWSYAATAPDQLDAIVFVTASRWIQIRASGGSTETTDAGASWHAFSTDYQQAAGVAPAITFGDAQTGYVTVRGTIERTTDGGAHWSAIGTAPGHRP